MSLGECLNCGEYGDCDCGQPAPAATQQQLDPIVQRAKRRWWCAAVIENTPGGSIASFAHWHLKNEMITVQEIRPTDPDLDVLIEQTTLAAEFLLNVATCDSLQAGGFDFKAAGERLLEALKPKAVRNEDSRRLADRFVNDVIRAKQPTEET